MIEWTGWLQQNVAVPAFWGFFTDTLGPLGWWVGLQVALVVGGTRFGLRLAWVFLLAALSNSVLKWLWAEPRPYWSSDTVSALRATAGFGMPSGHAQVATAFWGGLAWLIRDRRFWCLAIAIVFFTGVSRVYYGVHSPAQVLVGWGLGILLTAWLLWQLPAIEAFFDRQTKSMQVGYGVGIWLIAAAVMGFVYVLRADFVAPVEWVDRFAVTQKAFGSPYSGPGQMRMVESSTLLLLIPLLGYGLLALIGHRHGHYLAPSVRAKLLAFGAALLVNAAAIGLLWAADGPQWLIALWLLVQPIAAVWLPLRWLGELETLAASNRG